ncbi:MAG: 50S ribosomal protein L30 [Actinomycetota bacterium]
MADATITVTQTRSGIGTKPKHRGTLRALGLGKIGQTNTLPDRPEIRGMIAKVPHLITIGTDEPQGATKATEGGEAAGKVQEIVDEAAEEKADEPVPFKGDDGVEEES